MRYKVKARNAGHRLEDSKSGILAVTRPSSFIHFHVFEFFQ